MTEPSRSTAEGVFENALSTAILYTAEATEVAKSIAADAGLSRLSWDLAGAQLGYALEMLRVVDRQWGEGRID
jgi:hypothetical protein